MPEYTVVRPEFERAVNADLWDTATAEQRAAVRADPHAWRAALKPRMWIIEAIKNKSPSLPYNHKVNDDESRSIGAFSAEAARRSMESLIILKRRAQLRSTAAHTTARGEAEAIDAHEREDLYRLVRAAAKVIPRSEVAWWEMADAFVAQHRNGAPFVVA